jgi:hypothetical protein
MASTQRDQRWTLIVCIVQVKLRVIDGALQGTFVTGNQPDGVAFDGANIWVATFGSNTVSKM